MSQPCIQQKEIGKIVAILDRIVQEFYGNGSEGMVKVIPRIETHVTNLIETTKAQTTVLSALTKTVTEITVINDLDRKKENLNWKKAGIIISAILGVTAIISSIILKLF